MKKSLNLGICGVVSWLGLALSTAGCGADAALLDSASGEQIAEGETLGTVSEAVASNKWEVWLDMPVNANGFEGSPAGSLATPGGAVIIGRDFTTHRFRVSMFISAPFTNWGDFGTQAFDGKAAVAALDDLFEKPDTAWNRQIAVIGNSASKYYIRIGKLDSTVPYDSNPTMVHEWAQIPNTNFTSPPAATVFGGKLIVAGRSTANVITLLRNQLSTSLADPFSNSNWLSSVTVPALPAGWVAQGDPAIASTKATDNNMIIVTRAVNNNVKGIFANRWTGSSFLGWTAVSVAGITLDSEPAVEYGIASGKATIYVRSGSKVYQTSGLGTSWPAFAVIPTPGGEVLNYNPGAIGNFGLPDHHLAIARSTGNQFKTVFSVIGEP